MFFILILINQTKLCFVVLKSVFTGFRTRMVNLVKGFAMSNKNGVFLNSCFAHCQTERHDTWYAKNSPAVKNKVRKNSDKVLLKY